MINQLLRNQNAAATASLGKPIETFLGSLGVSVRPGVSVSVTHSTSV